MSRAIPLALLLALALCAPAGARWHTVGGGVGSGATATLTGATLSVPATSPSGSVAVTFATQAAVTGDAAAGAVTYTVQRRLAGGTFTAAAGTCATTLSRPATSCTDAVTADGTYEYRAISRYRSAWTAASPAVVTVVDRPAPAVTSITRAATSPTAATSVTWTVTFSQVVTGVDPADFALTTGLAGSPAVTGVSGSGDTYTVAASTGTGTGTLRLDVPASATVANSIGAGLAAGYTDGEAYALDRTAPGFVKAEMFDEAPIDGRIDRVRVTFDEPLQSTAGTDGWTLVSAPSSATLTGVSVSGAVATLSLTPGAAARDTLASAFRVRLATTATGIRDPLGNPAAFADRAPGDRAGPVLTDVAAHNGGALGLGAGVAGSGDRTLFTFSEPLETRPVTTSTLALTRNSVTIPGVVPTTALNGSYLTSSTATSTFAATVSTTAAVVAVELTDGGTCSVLLACTATSGTAQAETFTPVSTIKDPAGNTAPAYAHTQNLRLF